MFTEYDDWPKDQQLKFLARLAHALTVYARSTYEPGTSRVLEPELLRAYNEVQHRVTASLRDHVLQADGMPLSAVLAMLNEFGIRYGRAADIEAAISIALRPALGGGATA